MANKTRTFGSAYTIFEWQGQVIGMADQVDVASVTPVADSIDVQPINATRPVEILTPGAHRHGVITLTLIEVFNFSVWQRLSLLANSQDIVDIMRTVAALDNGIIINKVVKPPTGGEYREQFFNCTVVNLNDSEQIRIESMMLPKTLEIWYTHSLKSWVNGGQRQFPSIDIAPPSVGSASS